MTWLFIVKNLSVLRWLKLTVFMSIPLSLGLVFFTTTSIFDFQTAFYLWIGVSTILGSIIYLIHIELDYIKFRIDQLAKQGQLGAINLKIIKDHEILHSLHRLERTIHQKSQDLRNDYDGLEKALNALPSPLLLLNSNQMIIKTNSAANELLGLDLKNRHLTTSFRNPNLITGLSEAINTKLRQTVEFVMQTTVERTFLAHIEPLNSPAADDTTIVIALIDITAAQRSEQTQRQFIANASHEIRTPLATISGFIETLQGPAKDDPVARKAFLKIMEQHAERMTNLVNNLLSLSRIEVKEHTAPTAEIDLIPLLNNVIQNLKWQATARFISIEQNISDKSLPIIGDAEDLNQLFENLIENAIKYSSKNSVIQVSATVDLSNKEETDQLLPKIVVSVSDEGVGIAPEQLPRLTERFYRVDPARSRELGGTGLGLAIVKHIANRHKAKMSITSTVGEGSVFSIQFDCIKNN